MSRFASREIVYVAQRADGTYGEVNKADLASDADFIGVRAEMDYGTERAVSDALLAAPAGRMAVGAYKLALLSHNVMDWGGPGFEGEPATPENVQKLRPDDPLLAAALDAIMRRNGLRRTDPDPKASRASGSTSSKGATGARRRAPTT